MNNQSNQSADAVNQGGEDPVAIALEAFIKICGHLSDGKPLRAEGVAIDTIAALSSIKDRQAHIDAAFKQECGDTDKLLQHLGLDPEACRTEGGSLNLGRIKSCLSDQQAQPVEQLKDNVIAHMINRLRDVAIRFHDTQQLRERIVGIVLPIVKGAKLYAPVEQAHGSMPEVRLAPYPMPDSLKHIEYEYMGKPLPASVMAGVYHAFVRNLPAPQAPASKPEVWVAENKTSRMHFATKELADKYVCGFSGSVAGGMSVYQIQVIGETAQEQGRDDVIEECAIMASKQMLTQTMPGESKYVWNNAIASCMKAIRQLKEQSNGK